jgi:PTH1 family peptidyl-tRNA hydrolase
VTPLRRLLQGGEAGRRVTGDVWLIVGLGNPGQEYAATRHNVGYRVADAVAATMGGAFRAHRSARADVVEGRLGSPGTVAQRLVVARPRAYMNDSGGAVRALVHFYKAPLPRLVVVHDELDLPLGSLRVKFGGGDNGHNGLKSVRAALGTGDYHRVRVGIGRPTGALSTADFVLRPFPAPERPIVDEVLSRAAAAIESLVRRGLTITQSDFN